MWSIGHHVLILRDYLGFMLLSAMNFIFLIFFPPGHIYIYTAAQLDGEGAISVLFGLSALFLLHRGKGSGWLRIVEGP